jgi:hypothetical protein
MGTWESIKTLKTLEFDCRGQNTSHWGVVYIIAKLLKCRCRKWACMNHLDICSTSYDEKKGREFDSRPPKVGNRLDPGVWRWSVTHRWKALDESYNFASNLITIRGLHRKLCALKVVKIPVVGTKNHLDVAPMESCRVYYMGEGGGFPRVQAVVSLVSPKSLVACPNTKGASKNELTNLLVSWMYIQVNNWKACHSS